MSLRFYVENALRLMVVHQLAGNTIYLDVWYMYYVENLSPREVAMRIGLKRNRVCSIVQRMREVARYLHACVALSRYYHIVKMIEPVFTKNVHGDVCGICGRVVYQYPPTHIMIYHREIVEKIVEGIMNGKVKV